MIENVNVPEGISWPWEVKHFEITQDDSYMSIIRYWSRACRPWNYTKLTCNWVIVMSDTQAEKQDHMRFYREASGRVLIAWLGLWMITNAVAEKENVSEVVVLELSEDVIKLVKSSMTNPKIKVVHCDINEYKPTEKFDYAWFDIWNDLCTDNLVEMKKLQMQFRPRVKKSDCWGKSLLVSLKKEEDKQTRFDKMFRRW